MKVSTLKLNEKNPRKISEENLEKLKKSIQDFEEMMSIRPIIIDENNVVLAGNMRLMAIKALGYKDIPKEWVKKVSGLSEDRKREFIIKDNTDFGEWDIEKLLEDFADFPLEDYGIENLDDLFVESELEKRGDEGSTMGVMPPELEGENLEPERLPHIEGDNKTLKQRVIIVFQEHEIPAIERAFKMKLDKVLYRAEEIQSIKDELDTETEE